MPGRMLANPQEEEGEAIEHQGVRPVNLDKVLTDVGIGYFHWRLLLVTGIGFSAAAAEIVVLAFLLPELRNDPLWKLDEYQISLITISASTASIAGHLVWGAVADKYGRRLCFMTTVMCTLVFGSLAAFSPNLLTFICLLAGSRFGTGGNIAVDFALYSEFLPTQDRGSMLFKMQMFWPVGQLLACLAAPQVIPQYGWRMYLLVGVIPSLLTAFLRPLIPESPRWLLINGSAKEATEVCRHMAILNGVDPQDIGLHPGAILVDDSNEATPLATQSSSSKSTGGHLMAARLLSPSLIFTTLGVIIFGSMLHAISFGNLTFMPSLLAFKGFAKMDRFTLMIFSTLSQIPGVLACMAVTKYTGRLPLMKVCLLLTGGCFLAFAAAEGTTAVMICMCCAAFFAESCWGLFHVYVPEAYPTELRATAIGWVHTVSALGPVCMPAIAAYTMKNFGLPSVCMVFAFCGILGSVGACLFLHVETYDRELQDRVQPKSFEKAVL